jgi:hypothetical protein
MARTDYTPAQRSAWQAVRIAAERARGEHMRGVNALPRYNKATMDPFGRAGKLAEATNKPIAATVRAKENEITRQVVRKVPKRATLHANVPSTCFSDLSWKAGIATGVFARDGSEYEWPCDRETFIEWCGDSLGQFFNAEIR